VNGTSVPSRLMLVALCAATFAGAATFEPVEAPETEEAAGAVTEPSGRAVVRLSSPLSPMVRIAAGPIRMGSDEPEVLSALADCVKEPYGHRCSPTLFSNEMPRHLVHLSSFWIDRYEVRVADYEHCVSAGRCGERPKSEATLRFDRDDFPVSRVTWHDASAYCAFRGARLPTEAEFERAARGTRGRRYPWGDLFNTRATNGGRFGWDVTDAADGFSELAPVGSYGAGASSDGVFDLAGNVAEWTLDRYTPAYEPGEARDPRGPGIGGQNLRVVRGGSYSSARFRLRGASRGFAEPTERRSTLGFRCARSARGQRGGSNVHITRQNADQSSPLSY
jgi:formylglycine-generating enzyme